MATTNDLISSLMNKAYKTFVINRENSQCHKKLVEQSVSDQSVSELIADVSGYNISDNEKVDFDKLLFKAFFD